MTHEVYLVDNIDETVVKVLQNIFDKEDDEYKFTRIKSAELSETIKNIPSLVIIDEDRIDKDIFKIIDSIRDDEDNKITPIGIISSNPSKTHRNNLLKAKTIFYIRKPLDEELIFYTVKNIISLIYLNRKISPLSGLPGNVQIQAEMKKRLYQEEEFAMMYIDLDNFKAYNDVYGFSQGDEIIKFTAKIITKVLTSNSHKMKSFIGHIGGDDFIAIIEKSNYKKLCNELINEYEEGVLKYFTNEDIKSGYLEVPNRLGIVEQFPLTTISIAVVEVTKNRFKSVLEIGEAGAQVKKKAKQIQGSAFVIDKRRYNEKLKFNSSSLDLNDYESEDELMDQISLN